MRLHTQQARRISTYVRFSAIVCAVVFLCIASPTHASQTQGTILSSQEYGWGDRIGWINFAPSATGSYQGLTITDSAVHGYAWSRDYGWINFDPTNGGVTNTSNGTLGGYAWVSSLGWISFSGVTINANGEFVGTAGVAGTDAGRITFTCSTCSVATDWRPASVRQSSASSTPTVPSQPNQTGSGSAGRSGSSLTAAVAYAADGIQPTTISLQSPTFLDKVADTVSSVLNGTSHTTHIVHSESTSTPDYLFDISLRLEQNVLSVGTPLTALVSFTNFGTRETPVEATYSVITANGMLVSTSSESFIVQSENAFTRSFSTTSLLPGNYSLLLHVIYGRGTTDDVHQEFVITSGQQSCFLPWPFPWLVAHVAVFAWIGCWLPWWLVILCVLAICYILWRRWVCMRRMREQEYDTYE